MGRREIHKGGREGRSESGKQVAHVKLSETKFNDTLSKNKTNQ